MSRRAEALGALNPQQQQQIIHDEHPRMIGVQNELLETSVSEQLSPLAGFLVRTLNRCGPLTLKALAEAVRQEPFGNPLRSSKGGGASVSGGSVNEAVKQVSSPIPLPVTAPSDIVTDAAIKEIMTRLLLHRVVQHDPSSSTYSVALGYGLFLRTLFPVVVQFFQRNFGETGVTILMVFYQLAVVPWEAALRLATERRPALGEALRHCAREMEKLGLIEFLPDKLPGQAATASPSNAGSGTRVEGPGETVAADACLQELCRLHVPNILFEMLRDAIHRHLLAERFADGSGSNGGGSVASAIVEAFTASARCRRFSERVSGFPAARPPSSASMPLRALLREVPHPEPTVTEVLNRMCRAEGDNIMSCGGGAGVDALEGPYRFRYDAAVEAMQRDCCERMVFARHGVLGVRLIKLLLQHHHMEDRMLAEEAIATLPRTREVLHAMMRDGYVRQQEVPKTSTLTDRLPKNSIFLWGCNMESDLLPTVRLQVAMALRLTITRLAMERNNGVGPGTAMPTPMNIVASATATINGDVHPTGGSYESKHAVAALESSATALMDMMLVLDFY
ncbi:uncharacterized protein TEOVI_000539500 [Trypanosoma equiperdum]|uniref:DNA-directed RNA polymerase III subunit RPC3 n=2 Tax=Trypanozoon TaxID=39700 RepID=Q587G4_TRYB2|nr:hypothetical protein, conserved [Trypanosoma brucei brucei TREU927]AAQ15756.1 hypothetical protein, conserved [Trypanosoma brucei brucei TREU927]AAX78900.1 hypothetical protein, conserved [Trypanosoma brucei]SCU64797.1 hypothetical protein, conserved [Trypanosoma equiperdum]